MSEKNDILLDQPGRPEDEISKDTRWWHLNVERLKVIIMALVAISLIGVIVTQVFVNQAAYEVKRSAAATAEFYNAQGKAGIEGIVKRLDGMAAQGESAMGKLNTAAGHFASMAERAETDYLPGTVGRVNKGIDTLNRSVADTSRSLNGPDGVLPGFVKIEKTADQQLAQAGAAATEAICKIGNVAEVTATEIPKITKPIIEAGNEVLLIVKDEQTKQAMQYVYGTMKNVNVITAQTARGMTALASIVESFEAKINPPKPKTFWGKAGRLGMQTLGVLQGVGKTLYIFGLVP